MSRAPLPERPRRYRFALTPLADAMFQLLIFFMLSSSLTPYSLITLKSAPADAPPPEEEESVPAGPGPGDGPAATSAPTLWTVGRDTVLTEGQTYRPDQLVELAALLGEQDTPANIVLLIREDARVQDIATALEALESAEITALQLTKEGG